MPYTGTARMPAPRASGPLGALERLAANPVSLGQPGGRYAGSGLGAMMGVRSGMAPVGAVAQSRSDPNVSLVSLPHGNVAHMNSKYGTISTWSPVDDDERGTVYGKALAIDPSGKHYGYYSPSQAQALASKGWSVYGLAAAQGRAAKSGSSTGKSGLSLGGFLSGLFGPASRPAPANVSAASKQANSTGLGGLLSGLFSGIGPGAGGLGGGVSGGVGGLGGGGYGNPGFGGGISGNSNYGGL